MPLKRLLVLSPLPPTVVEALLSANASGGEAADIEVVKYDGTTKEDLVRAAAGADIILGDYTNNIAMDEELMVSASRCLLIQQPSTGYQHIDVGAAAREGIPVANVAGENAIAVAEHTIMMVLACLKNLMLAHEKTSRGEWAQDEMANYGVFEFYGKTLGIIGMGRIGREVARRAGAFEAAMVYYDVKPLSPEEERDLGVSYRHLDELLGEADIITIHAPLTVETENMMDRERISMMKPNAVVVNVARGALVDQEALAEALRDGRIMGAGIDVFEEEPVSLDNPLLGAGNTVLTPHIAGATNESRLRIINLSVNNILAVARKENPVNIVNGVEPRFD